MKQLIIVAATLLLAGCATTPRPPVTSDGFCALGLFYPDEGAEERWTEKEQRELVARNETAEQICGLTP